MKTIVRMPACSAPRLLQLNRSNGDAVELGDILFSYESDGALLFEYSACIGTVTECHVSEGQLLRPGDAVMTVEGEIPDPSRELFSARA